jgi:hypothetical protein
MPLRPQWRAPDPYCLVHEQGIKDAANHASTAGSDGKDDTGGDKRHEQNGKWILPDYNAEKMRRIA